MDEQIRQNVKFTGVSFSQNENTENSELGAVIRIESLIECESTVGMVLVASMELDHHEVIPSFPITLKAGKNIVAGPVAKIANPHRYDNSKQCRYLVSLKIHNFAETISFEEYISIS